MAFWQHFGPIVAAGALAALLLVVGFGAIGLPRRGGDAQLRPLWLFAGLGGGAFTLYVAHVRFGYYGDALATTYAGAAVLLGGLIGGALLARGLRGRRVGDHPHCRRCGFDLFGMPSGGVVCNECGTPLDAPNAVVVGVRHRRPVPLFAGAFLVVICVAIFGSAGLSVATAGGTFGVARYQPTSWLARQARAGGAVGEGAREELARRLILGELADEDLRRIVADAVATPGGVNRPDLVDMAVAAWSRGVIDESAIRRVVAARAAVYIRVAPSCTSTRIPYMIYPTGGASTGTWSFSASDRVDLIGNAIVPPTSVATSPIDFGAGPPGAVPSLGNLYRLDAPLADGRHQIDVSMRLAVTLSVPGRPTITETVLTTAQAFATTSADLDKRFPSDGDASPVMQRMTATIRDAGGGRATVTFLAAGDRFLSGSRFFSGDAFARTAAGERPLGEVWLARGAGAIDVPADAVAEPACTIVLRPTPWRAAETRDVYSTYQHEIAIDASRVTRVTQ